MTSASLRSIGAAAARNAKCVRVGQREQAQSEPDLAVGETTHQVMLGKGGDKPVDDRSANTETSGELGERHPAGPARGHRMQEPDAAVERLRRLTSDDHEPITPWPVTSAAAAHPIPHTRAEEPT